MTKNLNIEKQRLSPSLVCAYIAMLFCFGLLLSPIACSDSSEANGENQAKCKVDTDCPEEAYCDIPTGACVIKATACDEFHSCPPGYRCNEEKGFCEVLQDEGCPEGQIMIDDECVEPECFNDSQCPAGTRCNIVTYQCETTDAIGCRSNDDCPHPMICKNAACRYCGQDEDCTPEHKCLISTTGEPTCLSFICRDDNDCRDGWYCHPLRNACRAPCESHADCDPGLACIEGACREPVAECETDWDCPDRKLCTELQLCEAGSPCSNDNECGEGRRCDRNCIPDGCFSNDDCEGDRLCDNMTHECRFVVPTGSACGHSGQCFSSDICFNSECRRICNPYSPLCDDPLICGIVIDEEIAQQVTVCLPDKGGADQGEPCTMDIPCRVDLLCHNYKCLAVCDPAMEEDSCGEGMNCSEDQISGFGLCRTPPCDPIDNPCPEQQTCYQGECVRCALDQHCPDRMICEEGSCIPGCMMIGCSEENTFCNSTTGRCEGLCFPGCAEGYICDAGSCRPPYCDPPCVPPATCEMGRCVAPPDCRSGGCPNPLWICNLETGECEEPECPECGEGQCCNIWTDYRCSDECYSCSEDNVNGTCPSGYYCMAGQCLPIPCVEQYELCGAMAPMTGTPCCEGTVCCEVFPGSGGQCCVECGADGSCLE